MPMKLLPRRIRGAGHRRGIFRCGIAYMMSGAIELTSLGRMSTNWRLTAVNMSSTRYDLRKFFEQISQQKPYPYRICATRAGRAYDAAAGAIAIATGAVEVLSGGHLTTDWTMLWMCEDEETVSKIWGKVRMLVRGRSVRAKPHAVG